MALPALYCSMNGLRSSVSILSKRTFQISFSFSFPSRDCFHVSKYVRCQFSQAAAQSASKSKTSLRGKIATVLGLGIAIGGGYGAFESYATVSRNRYPEPASVDSTDSGSHKIYETSPTNIKPSRIVSGQTKSLGIELTLFQYQSCPFCCKVRAFLDYYGIPYSIVEVNPVSRSQTKFSKYGKVPILLAKDSTGRYYQLNDSSAIVSVLGTFLLDTNSDLSQLLPKYESISYKDETSGKTITQVMNRYYLMYEDLQVSAEEYKELEEERKWRIWVDDHLVHIISPNIYRSMNESLETFKQFSINGDWEKTFSSTERKIIIHVGALAMYFIGKRLKKKYNLKDDVRESLYDAAHDWTTTVGNRMYKGGDHPNLADLAVFGVLNSFEGCLAFEDLFKENQKFKEWFLSVKTAVNTQAGSALITTQTKKKTTIQTQV